MHQSSSLSVHLSHYPETCIRLVSEEEVSRVTTQACGSRCTHPVHLHQNWANPHQHPTSRTKMTFLKWNQHQVDFLSWLLVSGQTWIQHELTAASSLSSKILVRMSLRRGTVMIRMKGKAREATVDFTTHSRAIHNNWMMVNMFIRHVFTCMWNKSCLELWQGLVKSFYFAFFKCNMYYFCILAGTT